MEKIKRFIKLIFKRKSVEERSLLTSLITISSKKTNEICGECFSLSSEDVNTGRCQIMQRGKYYRARSGEKEEFDLMLRSMDMLLSRIVLDILENDDLSSSKKDELTIALNLISNTYLRMIWTMDPFIDIGSITLTSGGVPLLRISPLYEEEEEESNRTLRRGVYGDLKHFRHIIIANGSAIEELRTPEHGIIDFLAIMFIIFCVHTLLWILGIK